MFSHSRGSLAAAACGNVPSSGAFSEGNFLHLLRKNDWPFTHKFHEARVLAKCAERRIGICIVHAFVAFFQSAAQTLQRTIIHAFRSIEFCEDIREVVAITWGDDLSCDPG